VKKTGSLSSAVVEPYAQGLMSAAREGNQAEKIGEDLRSILELLDNSPELQEFVGNPVIKAENKKEILRRITGEETNKLLVNFLMLLVDKRRIVFLEQIGKQYLEILREINNIVLAEITSASELNDGQRQTLIEKVKTLTGAAGVDLETTVEPELIGGVIIKVGSQVFDSSLKGQLRRIGLSLGAEI